ncbi:hypothetical protein [Streptomyces sp. CC224B]|uniref:hypothetical protein n=1 Tax=Streptomyces sp. CC224B TaxID=3044571 RepID=UPI0024A9E3B1|nr:hypothetical protein [Streptomyces sp. CC224B]
MAELHTSAPTTTYDTPTPRWVSLLTDIGRPVVAAWVMIMCAPGEHHLGKLAGWNDTLAWGMAGVLAAYAGIAAAVASKRPKGAPGKTSAVLGAWLSLATAMSAQPVSHMFVTGHWTAEPRPPVWLVVAVSCIPPLVLGHLLHLAATPVRVTPVSTQAQPVTTPVAPSESAEEPEPASATATATAPKPITYSDPRCAAIRPLYDNGLRPGTKAMRAAIVAAGFESPSDGVIRGQLRAEVEQYEPRLAQLPPAPVAISA